MNPPRGAEALLHPDPANLLQESTPCSSPLSELLPVSLGRYSPGTQYSRSSASSSSQVKPHLLAGIDLENIVYYKDDTHYFVMTAKKQSLLKKGVIKQVRPEIGRASCRERVSSPV